MIAHAHRNNHVGFAMNVLLAMTTYSKNKDTYHAKNPNILVV